MYTKRIWGPKATTLAEAKELTTLPLDYLWGKLITHQTCAGYWIDDSYSI